MMFAPGLLVVCVDADFTLLRLQCPPALTTPVENEVYRVRAIVATERGPGMLLEEIDNTAVAPGFPEANFALCRFRPLDTLPAVELEQLAVAA